MVTIVKHEWHQVDSQFAYELTKDVLEEIYPDMDEDELEELWEQVEAGEADLDEILGDAYDNGVDIDWDRQYDDFWTDRKGGYDITYEYGDDDSWVAVNTPPPPTHKCTKCRWEGGRYERRTQHFREDGTVIEDYYTQEEDAHSEKEVCPMCDSDCELTEYGVEDERERAERQAQWDKEALELEEEEVEPEDLQQALEELKEEFEQLMESEEQESVPCYSCDTPYKESELEFLGGQYICPNCGEGWVMPEDREEEQ